MEPKARPLEQVDAEAQVPEQEDQVINAQTQTEERPIEQVPALVSEEKLLFIERHV